MAEVDGQLIYLGLYSGDANGCVCGGEPPTVENFEPANGVLESPRDPVSFDVFDDIGFRRIIVSFQFADLREEVVHDGDAFAAFYTGSVRTAIEGGYHYSVSRGGGFPRRRITVRVYPIDDGGNEPV